MNNFQSRFVVTSAVSAASLLAAAVPAHAFDFKVSGQVDRAMTAADNGEDSDVGFVDNSGSNTRFRFTGEQEMDNGLNVGFAYEIGLGENSSSSFDVNNGGGNNADFFDNRLANVFVEGAFGKVSFGKVDGAANGTSEVNYSGNTFIGGGIDVGDYAGGISFLDDDGNVIGSLGSAIDSFDALSRQNAVRYDSPEIGGAVLSASLDNGHAFELAGRYETEIMGDGKFGAAVDYLDSQSQGRDVAPNGQVIADGPRFREFGGSGSVLLPSGLNFALSWKHRNFVNSGDPSANNYFGSVGYILGKNHFELSYDLTKDALSDGSKGSSYGAAYVYDWTDSIEAYASYHLYTLDNASFANTADDGTVLSSGDSVDGQNINQIYLGARLKFL